jgi:CHAD domain-containing protein
MARTQIMEERELKFSAAPDLELPDFRHLVAGAIRLPGQRLVTTYFDTADMRLWGRGLTLRHRRGEGSGAGEGTWTLKLPDPGGGRTLDRTELTWKGSRSETPGAVTQMLAGIVRRAGLTELVELESARERIDLRDARGAALGETDDDTVTVRGGPRAGSTFRQIELELDRGQPEAGSASDWVDTVVGALRRAGAHPEDTQNLSRALGFDDHVQETPVPPGPDDTLSKVIRFTITHGLDALLDHDVLLRVDPSDPSAHDIHQARVAARRLRSDLGTFGPVLDRPWLNHATEELKWLGEVLGRVRDADVLSGELVGGDLQSPNSSAEEELRSRLAHQRQAASRQLSGALASQRHTDLLELLHDWKTAPPFAGRESVGTDPTSRDRTETPVGDAFPPMVRHQWKALRRKVRKASHHPSNTQLHQIRIKAKRLRYAAEAATPALGKRAKRTARASERLQTILGEHHDAVKAEEWLKREAVATSREASFVSGELAAEQRRRQHRMIKKWRPAWHALAKGAGWLE